MSKQYLGSSKDLSGTNTWKNSLGLYTLSILAFDEAQAAGYPALSRQVMEKATVLDHSLDTNQLGKKVIGKRALPRMVYILS